MPERQQALSPVLLSVQYDKLPPSGLSGNSRLHWAQKAELAEEWRSFFGWKAKEGWGRKAQLKRATLRITWEAKDKRRRDMDNLLSATKPAIDGLVDAGVLQDDRADQVQLELRYVPGAERDSTTIEVFGKEAP